MTMTAAVDNRLSRPNGRSGAIARIEVFHRVTDAERVWRSMETPDHLFTPFQRFDFLSVWQDQVGQIEGFKPFIVIGYDSGTRPLLLLALGIRTENGSRKAAYLGGKHATFNMPVLARNFALTATKADIDDLLDMLRAYPDKPDLLALERQPMQWMGISNPLSALPRQPSVNNCPLLNLVPAAAPTDRISNSFRKRLRTKERKLQALPGYRYLVAQTDHDINRILEAFFKIKPQRMAAQKLPNVFADPGIREFIFGACFVRLPNGNPAIEIHALECDEEVIAIFAGVADGHRFSMMFNTYTISEHAKYSPGLILLRNIIDHYAAQNYTSFDLGIGSDDYKLLFCKGDEPIFDNFLPLSTMGSIAGLAFGSLNRAKRLVKQTPALAQMAQQLRGAFHR